MLNTQPSLSRRLLCLLMALMMVFSLVVPASARKETATTDKSALTIARADDALTPQSITTGYIRNTYIEAYINDTGSYTIGTVEGDPNSTTDNNKKLLFSHPDSTTTQTLIRIDGNDYYFSRYVTDITFSSDGTECVATAMINGVEVKQILTLTTNPYTNIDDLVSIRYTYCNTTSSAKQVGVRIMLDTMLGSNDGAPFRVKGSSVTNEIEYIGNDVPQYWQSFDSLAQPNVTATGFFYFSETEKPDKVQFAYWGGIHNSSWNYTVSSSTSITGDSAVAAYFNPRTVAAGGFGSIVTYYGISGFSSSNSDLDGKLAVRVTAPSNLYGSDMIGGYLNNPFDVSVYLTNPGSETLQNVRAVLSLSMAPQLTIDGSQATTISVGNMPAGSSDTIQWTIRAIPQGSTSTARYSIALYADGEHLKTMPLTLQLNELNEENMYRTVKFDLNGGSGTAPASQRVLIGTFADKPADPTRSGYVFAGWYANRSCTGLSWFNLFNRYLGNPVTKDVTLYAKWREDTQTIKYFTDTYQFRNTDAHFFNGKVGTYAISGDYYDVLLDDLGGWWVFGEKQEVKDAMKETWGGSCFGMSCVLSLIKAGDLDPAFFQANANCTYDLDFPRDNRTIFNLINYYHLMQNTDRTANARNNYSNNEAENCEAIVDAVKYSDYPVVIGFNISDNNGSRIGGHAVVGYECKEVSNGYEISIWDPNDNTMSNTLTISSDYRTASFDDTYDESGWNSFLKYALTVEDGDYDYKNIQDALEGLGRSSGAEANALTQQSTDGRSMTLQTNYPDFEIVGSDGTRAVVVNGAKTEGDLDISDADYYNNIGFDLKLRFTIRDTGNVSYTITPAKTNSVVTGEPLSEYTTILLWNDPVDGFYSKLNAAGTGEITFGEDGTISTVFDAATEQSITVVANDAVTSWYSVTVEGTSTGLTVTPGSEETIISSLDETQVTVSAEDDHNTLVFETIDLPAEEEVVLIEDPENPGTGVIDEERREMGHSLIFYTRGGTPIEAQTNIPTGGTATRPADPTRGGFIFGGWYTSPECEDGQEWDFSTPIVEDTRIYAKWLIDDNFMHTVTFRAEGHDDIIIQVRNGQSLSEDEIPAVPHKPGYSGAWDITDFSNITADLIVNAIYTPNSTTGIENPFTDLNEDAYYYEAVLWAVENGITNGTTATTFSPQNACTRAEIVTFLWRAAGEPEPTSMDCPFTDVDMDRFYGKAVLWAVENNITSGVSSTSFAPNALCTRGQKVTFLYRYAGGQPTGGTNNFTDVNPTAFYADAVQWALDNSITYGTSETTFSPDAVCTRGQVVTFLYRYSLI